MKAKNMNEDFVYTEEDEDLDGALRCGCISLVGFVAAVLLAAIVLMLFTGCKHVEYVTVPQVRTEHHWHTDTVRQYDSTHIDSKTIIRELDSAAMAKYGIQMQANQRAWLVLQREMENRLRELEHMTAQRDTVRDSIPVPYPVEVVKEVAKEPSLFIKLVTGIGWVTLMGFVCWGAVKLKKYLPGGM